MAIFGRSLPVLGLSALLLLPRPAVADPVTLTSGYLQTFNLMASTNGVFQGQGFSMIFFAEPLITELSFACWPCAPGTTVHLGGSFLGPDNALGSAVVDGTSYPTVFFDGMTGTFTSPSFVVTGDSTFSVTQPFSYAGVVSGYLVDPFIAGFTEPAFTKTLIGQGTVSTTFQMGHFSDGAPTGLFTATDLRYEFSDAAAVPEPATMLLCGAGLSLLALRRRLPVHRSRSPQ